VAEWAAALERGLLPAAEGAWPPPPLRGALVGALARLGVPDLAGRYPGVARAVIGAALELAVELEARRGGTLEALVRDAAGADELLDAHERPKSFGREADAWDVAASPEYQRYLELQGLAEDGDGDGGAAAAAAAAEGPAGGEEGDEDAAIVAELLEGFEAEWGPAVEALRRAGATFDGVEELLGGRQATFDVRAALWRRRGWSEMDGLRKQLADCRQLRDLVRSLGRGAGWGPLRRSPVQAFDAAGRDGLLRSILEQQETRGLCRSDDLGRMLPAEAALLAKGRSQRPAKLLFYAKRAERALLSYERDGWTEQPTAVPNPLVREVRPTADRGPILLCVDTSGSMRGKREVVAKALALECMRAAREQERGCYAFCFAGPRDVTEMELGSDPAGLARLLDFLESTFNGGSNFDEPVKRCLGRLLEAEWANSDVLVVSDGELRPPADEWMRKLHGAKDKLGLRVHGLALPAAQTVRRDSQEADTSVLRALCTNPVRGGKEDVAVHVFDDWGALEGDIFGDEELALAAAVNRGKLVEEWRQREIARLYEEQQGDRDKHAKRLAAHPGQKYDKAEKQAKRLAAHPGQKFDKPEKAARRGIVWPCKHANPDA